MASGTLSAHDADRLTRRALRLARFTVAYNVLEGIVAVTAGLLAGLVSLGGFGLDSGVESAADEAKERRALKAVAISFFLLAAYVTIEGVRALVGGEEPDTATFGLVLLAASVIVMPILARAKRKVGKRLGDPLILADVRAEDSASWSNPRLRARPLQKPGAGEEPNGGEQTV